MKGCVLLILSSLFLLIATEPGSESPYLSFVKGVLTGTGETSDAQKLLSCLKAGDGTMGKFKQAGEQIAKMSNESTLQGLKLLLEAAQELLDMFRSCLEGFNQLKRLSGELAKADLSRLARKVQTSPGAYFHLSINVVEGFDDKKPEEAGKAVGTVLKMLFLSRVAEEEPAMTAFVKGFLAGTAEKGDLQKLLPCVKENEPLLERYKTALEKVKNVNNADVTVGAKMLLDATTDFLSILKNCLDGFDTFKHIGTEVSKADVVRVARTGIAISTPNTRFNLLLVSILRSI